MRILHVIPSIAEVHGGPSHAIARMAVALAARGVVVTIATTDDAGPGRRMASAEQEERRAWFAARGITLWLAAKGTEFYKVSFPLARWLWRHVGECDVVHIHALFSFSSIAAGLAAKRRGVPFVVRPLGVLGRYGMTKRRPWLKRLSFALIERPIVRGAAAVHCTSRAEADEVKALIQDARTITIPLGVEAPASANPARLLSDVAPPDGVARILFLSRLDPKKNLEGLLRAQRLLQARNGDSPFLIVAGDGPADYVAQLKQLAEELGIADRVAWLGNVEGERKSAAWAAADLFVLPSHEENFGIAAAEAMLAGLPSVLGEHIGLAPRAADAGAALLTTVKPEDVAACIARLLDDPALARAMGLRARAYAEAEFSIGTMTDRLEALYATISLARTAESAHLQAAA